MNLQAAEDENNWSLNSPLPWAYVCKIFPLEKMQLQSAAEAFKEKERELKLEVIFGSHFQFCSGRRVTNAPFVVWLTIQIVVWLSKNRDSLYSFYLPTFGALLASGTKVTWVQTTTIFERWRENREWIFKFSSVRKCTEGNEIRSSELNCKSANVGTESWLL